MGHNKISLIEKFIVGKQHVTLNYILKQMETFNTLAHEINERIDLIISLQQQMNDDISNDPILDTFNRLIDDFNHKMEAINQEREKIINLEYPVHPLTTRNAVDREKIDELLANQKDALERICSLELFMIEAIDA